MSVKTIYDKLLSAIGNEYGAIGLLGNIRAESGCNPLNMQNSYESKRGMNDQTYTIAVDNGTYKDFVTDRVGYGLCQWTSAGRKAGLLSLAKATERSIGNESLQIEWLLTELNTSYKSVLQVLRSAKTVEEASDIVLLKFERPTSVGANSSEETKKKALEYRRTLGRDLYNTLVATSQQKEGVKNMRVCLDAGHYGKSNRSPVVPDYYESDMTWKLCTYLRQYLTELGCDVITTRSNQNKDVNLVTRGKTSKGCDLFLSLHSNACGTESVDRPVAIYLVPDKRTDADERSAELASILSRCVRTIMGTNQAGQSYCKLAGYDRNGNGIWTDDEYYGVLFGAHEVFVPGIILEHSFHTNARAAEWLLNDDNLQALALAEAKTIYNYLQNKEEEVPIAPSSSLNYALVFNATYYSGRYEDLKKAFGTDEKLLLKHFKEYGMYEGRQAISTFNPQVYRDRYDDLKNEFGVTSWIPYYTHYMKYGYKEGRSAK